jgi:hypothetical protein
LTKTATPTASLPALQTTSFFIDSSGRSSFTLPLELTFASKADLDDFLAAKCLDPPPENLVLEDNGNDNNAGESTTDDEKAAVSASVLAFEVKSFSADDKKEVAVEGVTILSCSVQLDDLAVSFQTKVTVRAVVQDDSIVSPTSPVAFSSTPRGAGGVGGAENFNFNDDSSDLSSMAAAAKKRKQTQAFNVVTKLEITPVLTIQRKMERKTPGDIDQDDDSFNLMALELAAVPDQIQKGGTDRTHEARLDAMTLIVTLTHAFTISVKSVPGPKSQMGNTMVSLTIEHSNSHAENVTITNIALHPGHSRQSINGHQQPQSVGKFHSVDAHNV